MAKQTTEKGAMAGHTIVESLPRTVWWAAETKKLGLKGNTGAKTRESMSKPSRGPPVWRGGVLNASGGGDEKTTNARNGR